MGNPDAHANNTSYYYANGHRVSLTVEPGVFAVKFVPGERSDSPAISPEAQQVLRDRSQNIDFIANYGLQIYHTDQEGAIPIIQKEKVVQYASPAFRQSSGKHPAGEAQGQQPTLMFATNRFLVQFKPDITQDQINALNARYAARIVQTLDYAENAYLIEIPDAHDAMATIAVANAYQESGLTIFADPDFIKRRFVRSITERTVPAAPAAAVPVAAIPVVAAPAAAAPAAAVPVAAREATYLAQQWHLKTAHVVDAWAASSKGSPDITIAILDDGVDVLHPEFNLNVGAGKPKVAIQYDFAASVADGSPKGVEDNHGTACAGVATASGVMAFGAAPGCRLIVGRTPPYLGVAEEAAMFKWAADSGADVISCSWGPQDGVGAVEPLAGPTSAAIHYCVTKGRGGKGIPVFWAAGNGHECIEQANGEPRDGYADNPEVMAIAASTSDETIAWYSDFGKRIWVCAPSSGDDNAGQKRIFTVDRRGAGGYNTGNVAHGDAAGNYTNDFGGTSSATPLVAGIAALILSVQHALTELDVRDILKTTADKIGRGYDADGHSDIFGYGRVNALAAVQAAAQRNSAPTPSVSRPTIIGPQTILRSDPPPQFQVDPGPNKYYIVEVATQAHLMNSTNYSAEQNDTNFFGTWQGNPPPDRLTDPTYTLLQDVWDRLKVADQLYYRVGSCATADQSSWDNYLTSVDDDQLDQAPAIQISDGAGNADRNRAVAAGAAARHTDNQPAAVTRRDDTGASPDGHADASSAGDMSAAAGSDGASGVNDTTIGASDTGSATDTPGDATTSPPSDATDTTNATDTTVGDTSDTTGSLGSMDGADATASDTSGTNGDAATSPDAQTPDPALAVVRGIDVSKYQGDIDWNAVASSGIAFAFMKATEGLTFIDASFRSNWAGAAAARVLRGAYHFFRPARDAVQQADNFIQTVGMLGQGDLPPVLDIEVADGMGAAAILDAAGVWLSRVEQRLGRKPIIYTYPDFWRSQLGNSSRFASYPLWIAHYTSAAAPTIPGGWTTWTLWQRTDKGHADGITGNVDLDVFNGSIADLDALAGYTPPLETEPRMPRDSIPGRLPRPVIVGPQQWSRAAEAPTFEVLLGDNRYYAIEAAAHWSLFLPASVAKRTPNTYFGSYDEQGLLKAGTSTTYTLPPNVWAQLRQSAQIYYRVLTASSPAREPAWRDIQVSTYDDELSNTPWIALTGSGLAAHAVLGPPVHPEETLWRTRPA